MFNRLKDIVDSQVKVGAERFSSWRKAVVGNSTVAGNWFDFSMSPGYPNPKYWFDATPLKATAVYQSTDGGLFHGGNVGTSQKILRGLTGFALLSTPVPMPMILCDYLLYYPTIDETITDVQIMDNTITLPRYTTGEGVRMMAVSTSSRAGGATVTITYTNQSGTAGRTVTFRENTSSSNGNLVNCENVSSTAFSNAVGPFIQLQGTDTGVRSVQSVQVNGVGDYGLFSLVLIKPLANFTIRDISAAVEVDYVKDFITMPQIYDDAFLGFIGMPNGSLSLQTITGTIKTTFN